MSLHYSEIFTYKKTSQTEEPTEGAGKEMYGNLP